MDTPVSTLRPGLLVSLKTSIGGGAKYSKTEIEADHVTKSGARVARWETERVIADPKEYAEACTARNKARSLIRGVCTLSSFGLLCPEAERAKLDEAVAEARKVTDRFNKKSQLSKVHLYIIAGRVAQDDVEAIRAIRSEIRDLMGEMEAGVKNLDVKSVRDAAQRAKSMSNMLSKEAAEKVMGAVTAARSVASKIVKAGETAAAEIDKQSIAKMVEARTAFLDLDDAKPMRKTKAQARAVDLAPPTAAAGTKKRGSRKGHGRSVDL